MKTSSGRVVQLHLESTGFEVDHARSAEQALPRAAAADLVLTDLKLPGMDGLELLEEIHAQNAQTPVIVMTAFGSVETAVEAMKAGAADFLQKPFSLDHLTTLVKKVLEVRRCGQRIASCGRARSSATSSKTLLAAVPPCRRYSPTIMRVAPTRATVLLAGESGVGKDMIARAIHQHSPRKDRPFVKINCTALPENLMESELFGYEKGAFTGRNIIQARQVRAGRHRHGVSGRDRRCARPSFR